MTTDAVIARIPEWTFGDKVRKVRREFGLSQAEFGQRIDAKGVTVGSWESGTNEPRGVVAIAKRIELAFDVPAEWLLGLDVRSGSTPPPPNGGQPVPNQAALDRLADEKRGTTRKRGTNPGYFPTPKRAA